MKSTFFSISAIFGVFATFIQDFFEFEQMLGSALCNNKLFTIKMLPFLQARKRGVLWFMSIESIIEK